jgi:hypothetical protein
MNVPNIVTDYVDAYNLLDWQSLVDCVDENVVFENVSNSQGIMVVEGKQAFAQLAEQAATFFAKRSLHIRNLVVADNKVALEIDWTGVPAVDFGEFKAGVTAALRGAIFLTISGSKLIHITDLS